MAMDDAPLVAVAIEEEQAILAAKGYAGLIEQAIIQTNILALGLGGNFDHLEGLERDVVGTGKGHDIGNEHSGTAGEATNWQGALDDASDATGEAETLAQGVLGATGIVAPMAFLDLRGLVEREIDNALEGA